MRRVALLVGFLVVLASCSESPGDPAGEGSTTTANPEASTSSGDDATTDDSTPAAPAGQPADLPDEGPASGLPGDTAGSAGGDIVDPEAAASGTTGVAAAADPEDRPEPEDLPETVTVTTPTGVTGEVPTALLARVLDDLAARTGLARNEVSTAIDEAVIWPDGSLGCPSPGQIYEMAPVAGYRVLLQAAGSSYDYHLADSGYFVLCNPLQTP
jgi:hypothetical protein